MMAKKIFNILRSKILFLYTYDNIHEMTMSAIVSLNFEEHSVYYADRVYVKLIDNFCQQVLHLTAINRSRYIISNKMGDK